MQILKASEAALYLRGAGSIIENDYSDDKFEAVLATGETETTEHGNFEIKIHLLIREKKNATS